MGEDMEEKELFDVDFHCGSGLRSSPGFWIGQGEGLSFGSPEISRTEDAGELTKGTLVPGRSISEDIGELTRTVWCS